MEGKTKSVNQFLERLSQRSTQWAGSSWAFAIAAGFVVAWAMTGPIFGFSPGWQLVINTGTTIATFLMVFLIQRSQNKEARAVQLKLNEIIAAQEGASNRLVGAEQLSEEELQDLHDRYLTLAARLRKHPALQKVASVEETTGIPEGSRPGAAPPDPGRAARKSRGARSRGAASPGVASR